MSIYLVAIALLNPVAWLLKPAYAVFQDVQHIRVEVVSKKAETEGADKIYQLGSNPSVLVILRNDTDQRVKALVVDTYYQNRPRLFKDGKLVPYRETVKNLVAAKDNDPEFVSTVSGVFIAPYSSREIQALNLTDWYGPLQPGSYKFTNRYRLTIDGPWTADSAELRFEVKAE
ncbi:MAG TPA: hypothetical protein DC054_10475 [Blastocatellia bacterium]|nr:hypothetical protein [Blastocatellia bacterium]